MRTKTKEFDQMRNSRIRLAFTSVVLRSMRRLPKSSKMLCSIGAASARSKGL
jgi:hypothetical protein